MKDYKIEYLLLGQHYLGNEIGESYISKPKNDPDFLIRYCRQVTEAMETGVFAFRHIRVPCYKFYFRSKGPIEKGNLMFYPFVALM